MERYFAGPTAPASQDYLTQVLSRDQNVMYKTMADKLIFIPNDDTQNYPFCRLKLVFETFEYST